VDPRAGLFPQRGSTPYGRSWLAEGRLTAEETDSITEALERLSELYDHHPALEDQTVFPLAAAALPPAEKTSMGVEMAKRRGLDPHRTLEPLSRADIR
jgi:hypothetical protein